MLDNPKGGIGYAAEFQSSALPFVTSSYAPVYSSGPIRIDFPKITRFIQISNLASVGNFLRVGFTRNGVMNANYIQVNGGHDSQIMELRVTSMWLAGNSGSVEFSVCAGLTNIDANQMPLLSGSGGSGWLGVG